MDPYKEISSITVGIMPCKHNDIINTHCFIVQRQELILQWLWELKRCNIKQLSRWKVHLHQFPLLDSDIVGHISSEPWFTFSRLKLNFPPTLKDCRQWWCQHHYCCCSLELIVYRLCIVCMYLCFLFLLFTHYFQCISSYLM